MKHFLHLFPAPAEMSNDAVVRPLAAVLITAAFYVTAVIAWRAAVRHSARLFFRDPDSRPTATRPDPDVPADQAAMSGLFSGTA